MSCTLLDLSESRFGEEVAGSPVPVVAEFWAPWCPPCRAMAPLLHELAEEYESRLRFVRVNADEEPELARRYEVGSVPTFLVFADGELKARMVGARSRSSFVEAIDAAIR